MSVRVRAGILVGLPNPNPKQVHAYEQWDALKGERARREFCQVQLRLGLGIGFRLGLTPTSI